MDIPSINLFSNRPGGGILAGMNALNDYVNNRTLTNINRIKEQYAPQLTEADIKSKNAYAQLVGLQPMSKVLASMPGFSSLSEEQKNALVQRLYNAGANGSPNSLAQMPSMQQTQQPNTLLGNLLNKVGGIFGHPDFGAPPKPQNSLVGMRQQGTPSSSPNPMAQPMQQPMQQPAQQPQSIDDLYMQWMNSPKGKESIANNPYYYPTPKEMAQDLAGKPMEMEVTTGNAPKTIAQKQGEYEGTVAYGKESGKNRAEAQKDIGEQLLGLSNSGAVLDRMTSIVKNPAFQNMRNNIPYFQDKQLGWIKLNGTPEEKRLIGDFTTTAENYIASTVQSFRGKPLVREFDLAQRQKITDKDSVQAAEGKLRASIALKKIAEQKLNLINNFIDKGDTEAKAIQKANKLIDVSKIEQETNTLLRNKPTDADIKYMAQKRGISEDEVKRLLKEKGLL